MSPLFAALVLCWALTIRLRRACRRRGHLLDFAGAAAVLLCSWPPAAWTIAASLEKTIPPADFPPGEAQAMVVLAGNLYPVNQAQPETAEGWSTYLRTGHARWLYEHGERLPIVVSGGRTGGPRDSSLAELMRRQLIEEGVPEAMIAMEDRSMTTRENAAESARILGARGARRIVLVTEAIHMRRAALSFRKAGFEVAPAPCAYRILELRSWGDRLLPGVWAVRTIGDAAHEWAGLAWYKLRGWI